LESIKDIKFLKKLLISFSLVVVSGCFSTGHEGEKNPETKKPLPKTEVDDIDSVELNPIELERLRTNGEYLVKIAACGSCHSSDGSSSSPLSGGRTFEDEYGSIVVPNITSDKKTGIGDWTVGQIKRAIRENISRDGRLLSPSSHSTYRWLSDEDSKGIAIFLQSVEPRKNKIEPRTLSKYKLKKWGLLSQHSEISGYVPKMAENSGAYRGLYLASFVQTCSRCHSPSQKMADKGDFLNGYAGQVYFTDKEAIELDVPSIRNSDDGLKEWTEEQIVDYLGKTNRKDSLCPVEYYSEMSTTDKKAVASFLKSLVN